MKLLFFDLECSSLNAAFGIILACGSKPSNGKAEVLDIMQYHTNDIIKAEKRMLKDFSERLLDCDIWVTHFGTYFDVPFVNTRLLYHGLPVVPPNFPHIDLWKTCRYKLKLHNNRLASVSTFLKTPNTKNAILPEQWIRAISGHKKSMAYISEHCHRDLFTTEDVYMKIRCLITDHPSKGLIDGSRGCGTCGSKDLQRRGFHVTRTRKYQRYQCQKCGAWSKDTKPIEKITSVLEGHQVR